MCMWNSSQNHFRPENFTSKKNWDNSVRRIRRQVFWRNSIVKSWNSSKNLSCIKINYFNNKKKTAFCLDISWCFQKHRKIRRRKLFQRLNTAFGQVQQDFFHRVELELSWESKREGKQIETSKEKKFPNKNNLAAHHR